MQIKKFKICFWVFLLCSLESIGQVGIGTTNPQATLDIRSSSTIAPTEDDGVLIPKMSQFPSNPGLSRDGMLIFYTGISASGKGFYYWDATTSLWNPLAGEGDIDWYAAGTNNTPTSISDNLYTEGNVFISGGNLSVESVANVSNGFSLSKTINSNTGNTLRNANIQTVLNGSTAINNVSSSITGSGSGNKRAFSGSINSTGTGSEYGLYNTFSSANAAVRYGVYNYFLSFNEGIKYGVYNNFFRSQNGLAVGNYTIINAGSGQVYGNQVRINNGTGTQYGTDIFINNSTGTRYGVRSLINGASGTVYGIYSEVENTATGFSGYFKGPVSFGNNATNRYVFPASDGTADQVIATNGSGQLFFTDINALPVNFTQFAVAQIHLSIDQPINTNNYSKLTFNSVQFDSNNNFNAAAHQFEVSASGIYRVTVSLETEFDQYLIGSSANLAIFVNGEPVRQTTLKVISLHETVLQGLLQLTDDDLVDIRMQSDATVVIRSNVLKTSLEIERIR